LELLNKTKTPGSGRRQDVWSKKWVDPQRETKIEARKQLNIKKKTPAPSE